MTTERQALESCYEYLACILLPCDHDCGCVLHLAEEALGLPDTRPASPAPDTAEATS